MVLGLVLVFLGTLLSRSESFLLAPVANSGNQATSKHHNTAVHTALSGEEIFQRLQDQLVKLRQRDRSANRVKEEVCQ